MEEYGEVLPKCDSNIKVLIVIPTFCVLVDIKQLAFVFCYPIGTDIRFTCKCHQSRIAKPNKRPEAYGFVHIIRHRVMLEITQM
jgi:hypothetical protein